MPTGLPPPAWATSPGGAVYNFPTDEEMAVESGLLALYADTKDRDQRRRILKDIEELWTTRQAQKREAWERRYL